MIGLLITVILIAAGFATAAWLGRLPAGVYCGTTIFVLVAWWLGEWLEIRRTPRLRRAMELYELELLRFELPEYEREDDEINHFSGLGR